ncbi:MAG: type IX secretion system outer membrane channel protein PorV [Bacteroidetes bacterium]|nr:type IX secretion system outer membrane channel protein PorV [Bacteroidota bacterium]
MKNLLAPVLAGMLFFIAGPLLEAQTIRCVNGKDVTTGEPCSNAVTSAVPFLRITPDARGGALGDAGIATSADPNGMHFNQSKLAFADKKVALSATYTPWMRNLGLNDVYLAYLSGYVKIDKFQAIGFGLRYFSLGNIDFTDENGQSLGTGSPNEFEVTGAYSRKLSEKFSAGIGAKFIYSNLATGRIVEGNEIKPGIAGAADISFTYKTPLKIIPQKSDLTVGLAISNLGSKITYTNSVNRDFLPTNLGLGFAWRVNLDQFNTLTITSDLNKLLVPTPRPDIDEDGNGRADYRELSPIRGVFKSFGDAPGGISEEWKEVTKSFGLEYWYDDQFAVRTGYFYENRSKGNRHYFTVGIGVKYSIFGLNFSYLVPTTNNRNPLDNTLRFSLLFDFDALESEE